MKSKSKSKSKGKGKGDDKHEQAGVPWGQALVAGALTGLGLSAMLAAAAAAVSRACAGCDAAAEDLRTTKGQDSSSQAQALVAIRMAADALGACSLAAACGCCEGVPLKGGRGAGAVLR